MESFNLKKNLKSHKQVWAKVNVPVDNGVAELIKALSAFERLQTIESCEGSNQAAAWVSFVYGNYWEDPYRELAAFVLEHLGPELSRALGDRINISLQVDGFGMARGELSLRPGATTKTIRVLKRLRHKFAD